MHEKVLTTGPIALLAGSLHTQLDNIRCVAGLPSEDDDVGESRVAAHRGFRGATYVLEN